MLPDHNYGTAYEPNLNTGMGEMLVGVEFGSVLEGWAKRRATQLQLPKPRQLLNKLQVWWHVSNPYSPEKETAKAG